MNDIRFPRCWRLPALTLGTELRRSVTAAGRLADPLVLPALFTDAATNVRGCGAVLEVLSASYRQCSIQRGRPRLVGQGKLPNLTKITNRIPEWLPRIDLVKEPLSQLQW